MFFFPCGCSHREEIASLGRANEPVYREWVRPLLNSGSEILLNVPPPRSRPAPKCGSSPLFLPLTGQTLSDHQRAVGKYRSESALQLSGGGILRLLLHLLAPLRNDRRSVKRRGRSRHRLRSISDRRTGQYPRHETLFYRLLE